jgi:hypothetical protein
MEHPAVPVDVYEQRQRAIACDPKTTTSSMKKNGKSSVLVLDYVQRQRILMDEWYVPRADIAAAIRETNQARNQRNVTLQNLKSEARTLTIEKARRKFQQILRFQKSTQSQVQEMMKQAQLAESIRKNKQLISIMSGGDAVKTNNNILVN